MQWSHRLSEAELHYSRRYTRGVPYDPLDDAFQTRTTRRWAFAGVGVEHLAYLKAGRTGAAPPVQYGGERVVRVSLLVPAAVGAIAPAAWALARSKRRHDPRNSASYRGCGYDLRGNVSGACPECGRPVA